MPELALLVLACGAATYVWRALGVVFSGRVRPEGGLFTWVGCVAYAMIAGLITRIVLIPSGMLAETLLADRLLACAIALGVYYAARRNLLVGIAAGFAAFTAVAALRAAA